MRDMGKIFEITDAMGIDREHISVPLEKEDPGSINLTTNGEVEICVPLSIDMEEWSHEIRNRLEALGFEYNSE